MLHEDDGDEIRAIVLTGLGADPGSRGSADATAGVDPTARLLSSRRPVVAAIDGACRQLKMSLALAADIRVAGSGASFGLSDVKEGSIPGWNAIPLLVRVIGPARATPMILAGEVVPAEGAALIGLIHEVVPDPLARATELGELLAQRAPLALEYAKEAIWRGSRMAWPDALRLEGDFNHLLQASADRAEGLAAFFDKRSPRFSGR
jgi:enoyl-CoA hydratase